MADNKPVLGVKPNSQLDLERRVAANHDPKVLAQGYLDETATEAASYAVEGNDLTNYVGVSPEYMTYAEDTHKPLRGDSVETEVEDLMFKPVPVLTVEPNYTDEQIVGTGSKEALVYAATSGDVWTQPALTVKKGEEPTTVESLPTVSKDDEDASNSAAKAAATPTAPKAPTAPPAPSTTDK